MATASFDNPAHAVVLLTLRFQPGAPPWGSMASAAHACREQAERWRTRNQRTAQEEEEEEAAEEGTVSCCAQQRGFGEELAPSAQGLVRRCHGAGFPWVRVGRHPLRPGELHSTNEAVAQSLQKTSLLQCEKSVLHCSRRRNLPVLVSFQCSLRECGEQLRAARALGTSSSCFAAVAGGGWLVIAVVLLSLPLCNSQVTSRSMTTPRHPSSCTGHRSSARPCATARWAS